jgi:hypothetical protein
MAARTCRCHHAFDCAIAKLVVDDKPRSRVLRAAHGLNHSLAVIPNTPVAHIEAAPIRFDKRI